MKLYDTINDVEIELKWGEHQFGCAARRDVSLDKSASFVKACAVGAPLIIEEMKKREAPKARAAAVANKEWAKKAATFVTDRASKDEVQRAMKYVESK